MKNRSMPAAPHGRPGVEVHSHIQPQAFTRWDAGVRAAADDERSISIYDVIGQDYWTGDGVTAKRIAAALRALGAGPVTVNINSPGGDMFEGLAIYSLLREHDGEITVKVLGLAASAASVIAMAGDVIQIARAGFLMIHNAWTIGIGNRHDFRELARTLEPFDMAMADIYAARTGEDAKAMAKLMDAETWIGGSEAIEDGFADELLPSDQVGKDGEKAQNSSVRRVESALRASGMPKSEAMRLISELKATAGDPDGEHREGDPTEHGERDAADLSEAATAAQSLLSILPN